MFKVFKMVEEFNKDGVKTRESGFYVFEDVGRNTEDKEEIRRSLSENFSVFKMLE